MYDTNDHKLIDTPGECEGGVLQYNYTKDQYDTAPVDNWTEDYTQVTGNEVGRYKLRRQTQICNVFSGTCYE